MKPKGALFGVAPVTRLDPNKLSGWIIAPPWTGINSARPR